MNHRKSKGIPENKQQQKTLLLHYYMKSFDCVDHNKLWKILKEMVIQEHVTCLLRHLYAGQESTVKTGHGKTGSKLGKEYV